MCLTLVARPFFLHFLECLLCYFFIQAYLQIARQKDPRLVQLMAFAPSLTITILNVILPILFRALCHFEDWSPDFEVSIYLFRLVMTINQKE